MKANLSQATVAKRVGMTRTNYARIEYGKTNVTIDTLLRVADGIGLGLQIKLVGKRSKKA